MHRTLLLVMVMLVWSACSVCAQTECPNQDCPSRKVHAQSTDHTNGGACQTANCETKTDVCYKYCVTCAAARGICLACGRMDGEDVVPKQEWQGRDSQIQQREYVRITDASSWQDLWKRHAGTTPAPALDFTKSVVIGVFAGPSLESARIWVVYVRRHADRVVLTYTLGSALCGNEPTITSFVLIEVPRTDLSVRFEELDLGGDYNGNQFVSRKDTATLPALSPGPSSEK